MIRIVIDVDMNTGLVQVQGPIDEPRIMHFALGEALRACNGRSDARDAAARNHKLVVAHELPPGPGPG